MVKHSNITTVIKLLLAYLKEEGVEFIFGIPGGPLMPLYEALSESDEIQPVFSKHEEGAAFMADGYSRVSGKLGVCCSTAGPGATNMITGVACAFSDSIPLLVITAQVARSIFGKGATQESTCYSIDIVDMFKNITKSSVMLITAQNAGERIRASIRTALTGRKGPVHINIPADLMKETVLIEDVPPSRYRPGSNSVDIEGVKKAAELLNNAERPAIIAGHGVNLANANQELIKLAEHLSIPIATSPKGKGAFPENHPLSLGVLGFAGSPLAGTYLFDESIDVLMVVGSSLGDFVTSNWDNKLQPSTALIQVDISPLEIGKNYPVDIGIVGDALSSLREFNNQLEQEILTPISRDRGFLEKIETSTSRYIDGEKTGSNDIPIKPQRVMKELRNDFPGDGLLLVDIGACMAWALHCFPIFKPRTFFVNLGFASVGYAIPAGIGAKLARPNAPVFVIAGDGAFAMTGFEIHTAVELKLPIVWIILNNGGYGMVRQGEKIQFGDKFNTSQLTNPINVSQIANALGAETIEISNPKDLGQCFKKAARSNHPMVIEINVDIDEMAPIGKRLQNLDKMFLKGDEHEHSR